MGLLCCQAQTKDKSYYICNPVTQKWKKLPKPNANHGPDPAIVLVFEPSLLNFVAEYTLICAFASSDFDGATEFELYSSKEDSWKTSGEICFNCSKLVPSSGVHVNGVVYWHTKQGGILAFNLTKERSQLIRSYGSTREVLGTSRGKLCKVYCDSYSIVVEALVNIHTNTMQMGSKTKAWEVKSRLCLGSALFGGAAVDRAAVVFLSGDIVVLQNGERIYSYNFRSKEIKDLGWRGKSDVRFVGYVNSLVCI